MALIQFPSQTTSNAPSTNQNLIDFATATVGDFAQSMVKDAVKELGKETLQYLKGTHPHQIEQAKLEAENAAEVQKQAEDLRRLAEETKEALKQQVLNGQMLDRKSLQMVEHIAHILKDDSIVLGLQEDLMEVDVKYNPTPAKNQNKAAEQPIDFVAAAEARDRKENAA